MKMSHVQRMQNKLMHVELQGMCREVCSVVLYVLISMLCASYSVVIFHILSRGFINLS